MKTTAYIDGGNLYHGLLRGCPPSKWLDIASLLRDAYTNAADAFVIVSGDADFIAPLDLMRHELKRRTIVFNPRQRPTDLRFHATQCWNIPRDLPAKCQLPEVIPVGTHGRTIHRPAAWSAPSFTA